METTFTLLTTSFEPLITELRDIFHGIRSFRENESLVLLCGKGLELDGQDETNREILIKYAKKHFTKYKFILAEDVFGALAGDNEGHLPDLLTLEEKMAYVVDCIVIVLESIGVAAELGAFSLHPMLQKKILVLNDDTHQSGTSFLKHGPIKLLEEKSIFGGIIYGNLNVILSFAPELEKRLEKADKQKTIRLPVEDKIVPSKSLLLVLTDILRVVGPIYSKNVNEISKIILGNIKEEILYTLLAIGVGLKIFDVSEYRGRKLFSVSDRKMNDTFCILDRNKITKLRMKFLAKYSKILGSTFYTHLLKR